MSASILPDEAVFGQFRKQCSSTDNWRNKYDKNGMQVWVEVPPVDTEGQKSPTKIHMIKVGSANNMRCMCVCVFRSHSISAVPM